MRENACPVRLLRKKFNECESRYSDLERTSCAARRLHQYTLYHKWESRREGECHSARLKGKASVQSDMKLHSKRSADKECRLARRFMAYRSRWHWLYWLGCLFYWSIVSMGTSMA